MRVLFSINGERLRQLTLMSVALMLSASGLADTPVAPSAPFVQIDVNGVGELQAEPDEAVVNASLRLQGNDSIVLVEQASEIMALAINSLRESGVAEKFINAGQVHLDQRWRYTDGKQEADGYEVRRPLTVRLDDINLYPATIALLSKQGINGFDGVNFEFSQHQLLLDQTTQAAVADAVRKAGIIGRALGQGNCRAHQVSVGNTQVPRPRLEMTKQALMVADTGGYNPGDQLLRVEVTATFQCQ